MDYKLILIALGAVVLLGTTAFLVHKETTPATTLKAGSPSHIQEAFKSWCEKFNVRMASPEEEQYRMTIFESNYLKIANHPSDSTYALGENQFMIVTTEEFKANYLGLLPRPYGVQADNVHIESGATPSSVNWAAKGDVTPVKNQGQCGSCWAFSTTGSIEASNALKFGSAKMPSLSEQQLVDCSGSYGNNGCGGGLMDYAFQYVEAKGLNIESAYPYTARDGRCTKKTGAFKITGYTDVKSGDCSNLASAVAQQPVSIGVDAEQWQFYSTGVFSDCGTQLDHGVLAAGYDNLQSENGTGYWLVKNSWGASWGEKGYIRFIRKSGKGEGICGITKMASYPNQI